MIDYQCFSFRFGQLTNTTERLKLTEISLMLKMNRLIFSPVFILFAITAGSINEANACISAAPSAFAVKDQNGVLLTPDEGSSDTYTVNEGTTLTFEVEALISLEADDDKLVCEWYNSAIPNNGKPIATLGWWWWQSDVKDPAAPPEAPEQPNTIEAPPNTTEGGLFAFRQTFNRVTPENNPIKITAGSYASEPGSTPCPGIAVDFFVNVTGRPDQTPPDLTPGPASAEISAGIGDRVLLNLNTTDPEDNLQAIEWYVEGFETPLRANGVNTLNAAFGSPNEDSFAYRFEDAGRFDLTVLAYDDFLNGSTFTWSILVREPILTRSVPCSAEISVNPVNTESC